MRKHRIIQSAIAAAACLALIWGIGYKTIKPEKAQNTAVTNSFVVKVNAAEIKHTKKNQMRVYANPGYTSMWCGGEAGKQFVSYSINAPLQFEGNNIKTVTYRINKGHFFVTKAEHSKYFKEGELCKGSSQSNYRFFTVNAKETPEKQFTVSITDDDCKISSADATALFDGKAESDSELHARNISVQFTNYIIAKTHKADLIICQTFSFIGIPPVPFIDFQTVHQGFFDPAHFIPCSLP